MGEDRHAPLNGRRRDTEVHGSGDPRALPHGGVGASGAVVLADGASR
jgi:hypothetical protein